LSRHAITGARHAARLYSLNHDFANQAIDENPPNMYNPWMDRYTRLAVDDVLAGTEVGVGGADETAVGPSWRSGMRFDPFSRIYYITSGQGFVYHPAFRYELVPQLWYLIPGHAEVKLHCPTSMGVVWADVSFTVLGGMDLLDYLPYRRSIKVDRPTRAIRQMRQMGRWARSNAPADQLRAQAMLLQIAAMVFDGPAEADAGRRSLQTQRFVPVLQYIENHLHQRMTVAELAACVGLEATYFSSLFAATFRESPYRFVLRRRVLRVQQWLLTTEHTLEWMAERLAFADAFHLSRVFKRTIGMSPTEYRRRHRERLI